MTTAKKPAAKKPAAKKPDLYLICGVYCQNGDVFHQPSHGGGQEDAVVFGPFGSVEEGVKYIDEQGYEKFVDYNAIVHVVQGSTVTRCKVARTATLIEAPRT